MKDFSRFYTKNTQHYALAVLGIIASSGLAFTRANRLSLPLASLSFGYGVSIAINSQRTSQFIDEIETQIRADLVERIESLDSRLSKAIRECLDVKAERDNLVKSYDNLAESRAQLKASAVSLAVEYQDLKNNFDQRLAAEFEKYKTEKDAECEAEIQAKEREFVEKIQGFARKWDLVLKNKDAVIAEYQSQWEAVKGEDSEIESEFYNLEKKITHLQALASAKDEEIQRLGRASLKLDATFPTGTYAGELGNQVLGFYRTRKLEVAPIDVTPKPSGVVEVWLQPFGCVQADFEQYLEEFYYEFKPLSQPRFDKADGYLKMVIKSGVNEKESKLKDPPSDYFEQALKRIFHIRVTGETDTGKSTLVNNVVGLILAQNPNCEIKLYNPQYGSKYDKWQIDATWRSFDQFPEVIGEIETELENRGKVAAAHKDRGLGYPNFPVRLYIVDECENSVSLYPDSAKSIKRILNHGRHQDVFVVYVTQSPLASAVKLNRPDFNASIGFHLGRNALRVIKDLDYGSEFKDSLTTQYELRQQRGDKFTVLCDVKNELFWACAPAPDTYAIPSAYQVQGKIAQSLNALLDKPLSESASVGTSTSTPKSDGFSGNREQAIQATKCPRCQSTKLTRKGRVGIKQKYQCKDCKRNFTADILC